MEVIRRWFQQLFADPQTILLTVLLLVGLATVMYAGQMLAPVFGSVVIAYMLEGPVRKLEQFKVPRLLAVIIVFLLFVLFVLVLIFGVTPVITEQFAGLLQRVPTMMAQLQESLLELPQKYPGISEEQIRTMLASVRDDSVAMGQELLAKSLTSVVSLLTVAVYLVLMPLLVFFFLKDKDSIVDWFVSFLPNERQLATSVWAEVNKQTGNYIRGKVYEILIIWAASYVTFSLFGLQFAMLLGVLVGLSVIMPYVGATVVTLPVAAVAYFQWGPDSQFVYLVIAYLILQALDGNVLVPLLFSEVVNLHPVAIIVAILFFGGLWGIWGVFFAIPLATLVQAVLKAWPRQGFIKVQTDTPTAHSS